MILAACRDIRPGRKAADDLLSVPTPWVGHPVLCSLCGEFRQTREEARPFSVAALSSGPVPLSSGSHQGAPSLRPSSASDRESYYAVFSLAPSGTTPNSRKRHSAINNFRARATIPTLRARVPPPAEARLIPSAQAAARLIPQPAPGRLDGDRPDMPTSRLADPLFPALVATLVRRRREPRRCSDLLAVPEPAPPEELVHIDPRTGRPDCS